MNATKIVPANPPHGDATPSCANSQPPTNAPTIPMMMSPISPYPVPPITSDASTPAIRPTISHVRIVTVPSLSVEPARMAEGQAPCLAVGLGVKHIWRRGTHPGANPPGQTCLCFESRGDVQDSTVPHAAT